MNLGAILPMARKNRREVEGNAVLRLPRIAFRLLKTETVGSRIMQSKFSERHLPPAKNLKRAFECAVQDIHQAGLTGRISRYRTPIVQRASTIGAGTTVDAEKRALADAAKALAQLWKIAPSSSR